ncbi:MAG: SulP family inorganic anion transporter, partial [Salinibacter sp.]
MWHRAWTWFRESVTLDRWLSTSTPDTLRKDVVAGLTVGVMLIPQSMAYAVIAGLPPIYGLYGALVPLLIYPVFG